MRSDGLKDTKDRVPRDAVHPLGELEIGLTKVEYMSAMFMQALITSERDTNFENDCRKCIDLAVYLLREVDKRERI